MEKKWVYTGDIIRLLPNMATVTPVVEYLDGSRQLYGRTTDANLKKKRENLELSSQSRKKLTAAINWLYAASRQKKVFDKAQNKHVSFRVNFITLTIPVNHGRADMHELAPKMLNNWLTYMRTKQNLANYVWKLEFTKANVQHYHLTTDTYLNYMLIRNVWNYQLKAAGCLDNFYREHGHYNPNSTDVHATKHVRDFCSYMCKYLNKAASIISLPAGRLWSCSQRISKAIAGRLIVERFSSAYDLNEFISEKIEHIPIIVNDKLSGIGRTVGDMFKPSRWGWVGCLTGAFKKYYDSIIGYLQTGNENLLEANAI